MESSLPAPSSVPFEGIAAEIHATTLTELFDGSTASTLPTPSNEPAGHSHKIKQPPTPPNTPVGLVLTTTPLAEIPPPTIVGPQNGPRRRRPKEQLAMKRVADLRRRTSHKLGFTRMQNVMLHLNPTVAEKAQWMDLPRKNIHQPLNTSGAVLRYEKVNIIESAALSLQQTRDTIAAIVKERQQLQNMIKELGESGTAPEDILKQVYRHVFDDGLLHMLEEFREHFGTPIHHQV